MARAEIHPFENEIFDHFRNEIKEKKKWIKINYLFLGLDIFLDSPRYDIAHLKPI